MAARSCAKIIVFFALLFFPACADADTAPPDTTLHAPGDAALEFARKLEASGLFEEAITEYKRYCCFNRDGAGLGNVLVSIAFCYSNEGLWSNALDSMQQSFAYCESESELRQRNLLLAQFEIASKNYGKADVRLSELLYVSDNDSIRMDAAFYLGVSSVYQYAWEKAHDYFMIAFSGDNSRDAEKLKRIDALISHSVRESFKSADTARILSTFIPGLGQAYAGKPGDGAVSFCLNVGVATWLGFLIASGDWADSLAVADFIFMRFYTGNITNAGKFADEYNAALSLGIAEEVLRILDSD